MRVSVNGDGYGGVFTARPTSKGWQFIKNDGTVLTTGWGVAYCSGKAAYCGIASPTTRDTPEQMITDVLAARPKIQITEIQDVEDGLVSH